MAVADSSIPAQRLRLRDGRWVAYAERGVPSGTPVVLLQGTPSSRLLRHPDDSIARSLGARIVTIDRPGFGLSDFHRRRTLLDWPADIAQVADHLGIERFAVVGFSGGGPYVAACAHQIPHRLTRALTLAGAGPIDVPGVTDGMTAMRRLGMAVAARAPWMLRPIMAARYNPRRDPERFFAQFTAGFPPSDVAILAQPEVRTILMQSYAEATRQGVRGLAWEMRLFARPWGFRLEDIAMELHVWHGELDTSTPVAMAHHIASTVPRSRARIFPGEGHMLFFAHWHEVLEVLIA